MKDFEGKILKIYFNSSEGFLCLSAAYIKTMDDFLVVKDNISKKLKYLNMNYIRQIEIVGDING